MSTTNNHNGGYHKKRYLLMERTPKNEGRLVKGVYENLSGNLRFLRILRGLSQEQVGEMTHISRRHYCECENGAAVPNLIAICILADFYDVSIDKLIASKISYTFEGPKKK